MTRILSLCLAGFLAANVVSAQSRLESVRPPASPLQLTQESTSAALTAAPWQLKLDPGARLFSSYGEYGIGKRAELPNDELFAVHVDTRGRMMVDVFIQLTNGASESALDALGVERRGTFGRIVSGRIEASRLDDLAHDPAVTFVELSRKHRPLNQAGRVDTKADLVYNGTGLPQAYRGEGVVVGVLDSGIDFSHPDFSDMGGTRIQYLLEYTEGGGQTEWTKAQIDADAASVTQRDGNGGGGHGTHVAGTAAGGGKVNPAMMGVAPEADIIFVKGVRNPDSNGGFADADIVNGSAYIFEKAAELGKPAVVNLSLGGHSGPHDGTALYEQALSDMTGPGKIIMAAAGNEGFNFIHAGGALQSQTTYATILEANNPESALAEMWYEPGAVTQVSLVLMTIENEQIVVKQQTDPVPVGQYIGWDEQAQPAPIAMQADGTTIGYVQIDATTTQDPRNGDGQIYFVISNNGEEDVAIHNGIWGILTTSGTGGRMDMWVNGGQFFSGTLGFTDVTELAGDTQYTVGSPSSGHKVISVGSYVTSNSWTDIDGNQLQQQNPDPSHDPNAPNVQPAVGQHSFFSSIGPTRDGRTAPDIAAPGEVIFSALSSHLTEAEGFERARVLEGGQYLGTQGTSMASPHATGIVALMLQADPTLDPDKVRQILQETARADAHTGTLPNNKFGAGKIDAQAAVQRTLELIGVGAAVAQVDVEGFDFALPPGSTASTTFELSNTGGASLTFSALANLTAPGKATLDTPTLPQRSTPATGSSTLQSAPASGGAAPDLASASGALITTTASATATSASASNRSFPAAQATDILYLDDGNGLPDEFLGFGDGSEFYWLNQFDLTEAYQLDEIYFYMRSETAPSNNVWLAVYDGEAEELTSGTLALDVSQNGQWFTVPLNTPLNFAAGSTFFIEVGTSGVDFPAGVDATGTITGRSFFFDSDAGDFVSVGEVEGYANAAWLIRVGGTLDGGMQNQPPAVVAQLSATSVEVGESITFDASGSSDSDGAISAYSWNFGDGNLSSQAVATHAYQAPGTYTYVLTVTDNGGATGQTSGTVTVATPPSRFTVTPASGSVAAGASQTITVAFDATDLAEGSYAGTLQLQTNGGSFNLPVNVLVTTMIAAEDDAELPRTAILHQNFPNPFNPSTSIRFELPAAGEVRLEVFDVLGRRIATLVDGDLLQQGPHETRIDAAGWSSGVYLYRLDAGAFSQTRRMTLMK